MVEEQRADSVRIVCFGIALGILGTVLTFQHYPALGFTLYLIALIGSLFLCARLQRIRPITRNLPILVPVLFFALMFSVHSSPDLMALNLFMGIFATLLLVYFFANGSILQQDLLQYAAKSITGAFHVWLQPFGRLAQSGSWVFSRREDWPNAMPYVRGLIITIPVVAVFVVLLSAADSVFSAFVSRILNIFNFSAPDTLVAQAMLAGVFGWTAIGGLSFALWDRKIKRAPRADSAAPLLSEAKLPDPPATPEEEAAQVPAAPLFSLGFTESTMLLGSVCAVFLAFVAIQFVYLFGGQGNIIRFTYADYLHRGFTELIIVSLLTLGMAYLVNILAIRKDHRQLTVLRGLLTLLIVLTGVILVSAFQRLRLYEDAYGVSSLRLIIEVFIVWLGILFVGFATSLYWQPHSVNVFGVITLVAVFGFAATIDILNPDAFVAREMIDKNDVDPLYLVSLSDEALPLIVSQVDAPEKGLRNMARSQVQMWWTYYGKTYGERDWRDFSVTDANAFAAVSQVKDFSQSPITAEDFTALKRGMKYREVLRLFGDPTSSNAFSDDFDTTGRTVQPILSVSYTLSDKRTVNIHIDSTQGVIDGAPCNNPCTALIK